MDLFSVLEALSVFLDSHRMVMYVPGVALDTPSVAQDHHEVLLKSSGVVLEVLGVVLDLLMAQRWLLWTGFTVPH